MKWVGPVGRQSRLPADSYNPGQQRGRRRVRERMISGRDDLRGGNGTLSKWRARVGDERRGRSDKKMIGEREMVKSVTAHTRSG